MHQYLKELLDELGNRGYENIRFLKPLEYQKTLNSSGQFPGKAVVLYSSQIHRYFKHDNKTYVEIRQTINGFSLIDLK